MTKSVHSAEGVQLRNADTFIDRFDQFSDQMIASIPSMMDVDLISLRQKVQSVGDGCWRVQCAIDAEIIHRAEAQPRGRGNKDTEQAGKGAAVNQRAAELGINPRTLYKNAAIYNTFLAAENTALNGTIFNLLSDKTYFAIALEADDPIEALKSFAEQKAIDPDFSCQDARRMIQRPTARIPNDDDAIDAALNGPEAKSAWLSYQLAAKEMIMRIPTVRPVIRGHMEEIAYELSRPSGTLKERLLSLIEDGFNTLEHLADMVKLAPDVCKILLQRLVEAGELRIEEQGGKTDAARGAKTKLYFVAEK